MVSLGVWVGGSVWVEMIPQTFTGAHGDESGLGPLQKLHVQARSGELIPQAFAGAHGDESGLGTAEFLEYSFGTIQKEAAAVCTDVYFHCFIVLTFPELLGSRQVDS